MEIRYIKPEEAADYQKVSAASFIWKFNAEEDNTVNAPVLAAFDEGRLIAGVEMIGFRMNYCGSILKSLVVSGVCSRPECRRMGGIREIMKHIGETALENDLVAGFLHPFSISYYEKFGYANLNHMFTIRVPFENLKHIPRNTEAILYTGEQFEELSELHRKCAMQENLMPLRENKKQFCDTPLEKADYTYFRRDKNGVADGYVRFIVQRPDVLVAEELFALTPEAVYGLIGFLRNYDGIVKTLMVRKQYHGSNFSCIADRIDGVAYEDNGVSAGRIYNMQKLLECNAYPEEHGSFRVKCIDEFEQNNGIFEVEYQNGRATVTRSADGDYDISLTAPAAAKLMLAGEGHTAQTAEYINGVEIVGDAADFFRAFPYRPTRFVDSSWSEWNN
ncbi:MAG: GNAT family N-acetyltransferase [Clostridia bacterium]|nr:GNAT family N-acetyltransferase [Clostridia bacterium]